MCFAFTAKAVFRQKKFENHQRLEYFNFQHIFCSELKRVQFKSVDVCLRTTLTSNFSHRTWSLFGNSINHLILDLKSLILFFFSFLLSLSYLPFPMVIILLFFYPFRRLEGLTYVGVLEILNRHKMSSNYSDKNISFWYST